MYLGAEDLEPENQVEMSTLVTEGTGEPLVTTGGPVTEARAVPPITDLRDSRGRAPPSRAQVVWVVRRKPGARDALALTVSNCMALGRCHYSVEPQSAHLCSGGRTATLRGLP